MLHSDFKSAIEGTAETMEEKAERYKLMLAYRRAFDKESRRVLKDRLWELGFLQALDLDNLAAPIRHNEAVLLLIKLGILTDKDSFDRVVDAMMNLPIIEQNKEE